MSLMAPNADHVAPIVQRATPYRGWLHFARRRSCNVQAIVQPSCNPLCTIETSSPNYPIVSDGLKTNGTCRFENRVRVGGRKTPSEGCSDGGAGLDWLSCQVGLIWSLVR